MEIEKILNENKYDSQSDAEAHENEQQYEGVENEMPDPNRENVGRSKNCWNRVKEYELFRLALLSIFAYTSFGIFVVICAVIIQAIELPQELIIRENVKQALLEFSNSFQNKCFTSNEDFEYLRVNLRKYEQVMGDTGRLGMENESGTTLWSFQDAAVFIFTVISSIGISSMRTFLYQLNYFI